MSKIHMLNIPLERARAIEVAKALKRGDNTLRGEAEQVARTFVECLDDALRECHEVKPASSLAQSSKLEQRIDAAGRYIQSFYVELAAPPHAGWLAVVKTDAIGGSVCTFGRYAESPADALALSLSDAAEWVQKQRDLR